MTLEQSTPDQIVLMLIDRRKGRKLAEFHAEVERLTGMTMSKSHLANIMSKAKKPNDVVMKYLGGTVEKTVTVVYQIEKQAAVVAANGKRGKR